MSKFSNLMQRVRPVKSWKKLATPLALLLPFCKAEFFQFMHFMRHTLYAKVNFHVVIRFLHLCNVAY